MGIRSSKKDHRIAVGVELSEVAAASAPLPVENEFQFYTKHDKRPCHVDLTSLSTGQQFPLSFGRWAGPYSGRPELLQQLFPAIKEWLLFAAEDTVSRAITCLRKWWRLLDDIEAKAGMDGSPIQKLKSVGELGAIHARLALDSGFDAHEFGSLRYVADTTRRALGLRPLGWKGPPKKEPKRHLPPEKDVVAIWNTLKRGWFSVLDRWRLADSLLSGEVSPRSDFELRLLENFLLFKQVQRILIETRGFTHPSFEQLRNARRRKDLKRLNPMLMYELAYPSTDDTRHAFHLSLAGTGWNVQTLLDLEVDTETGASDRTPFLRQHPSDPNRYVLCGFKERGESEPDMHGDWRTDRSPGSIIRAMVERTWPLRERIIRHLRISERLLKRAVMRGVSPEQIKKLWDETNSLRQKSKSVWLFYERKGVSALTNKNYAITSSRPRKPFMMMIALGAGIPLTGESKRSYLTASDFRDAFAQWTWQSSGGSVLHVMAALRHRRISTTGKYLDNTSVNQESIRIFLNFSDGLWNEIANEGKIDPTVLALVCRDGQATKLQRLKLEEYRELKRTRMGTRCRDPFAPPAEIDPTFVADGVSMCTVHRCTLCHTHAVITEESMDGLSMRNAELLWLRGEMPADSFAAGEYQTELDNTQEALRGFEAEAVAQSVDKWCLRIREGTHRPLEFNGIQIFKAKA